MIRITTTDTFDTPQVSLYNEEVVKQIAETAAADAVRDVLSKFMSGAAQLDSSISQTQSYHQPERLTVTVQEVADLLGVSKPIAYGLVKDGSIRSIRIGRKILIPRQAVEEYLNN